MASSSPSFFRRIHIAFNSLRRILRDPGFAQAVATLTDSAGMHQATGLTPATVRPSVTADSALLLLGLLQKEGRLIDFLYEDIQGYSDQEVGAGARVVHQGCQRVLHDYLMITPVRDEPEGSRITLERGFDAAAMRPTGQVVGEPPFAGTLRHRGWRVNACRLPQISSTHDLNILAAAEVEL